MKILEPYYEFGRTFIDRLKLKTYPIAVKMIRPDEEAPQVVSPGMGYRIMAGVQDNEMIFSITESELGKVAANLFLSGNKISDPSPFSIPNPVPSIGANRILGNFVEPLVWPTLRKLLSDKGN